MSNEPNTKPKPLILALNEAEEILATTVNNLLREGIPCFYLELVVDKIHRQLKVGATAELEQTKKSVEPREEEEST